MSDVVLSNGREITINLDNVSWGEHLGLFNDSESDERSDKTLAKAAGLDYKKEYLKLSVNDCKRIANAYFKKSSEPLADPNSVSAPTSP